MLHTTALWGTDSSNFNFNGIKFNQRFSVHYSERFKVNVIRSRDMVACLDAENYGRGGICTQGVCTKNILLGPESKIPHASFWSLQKWLWVYMYYF